VHPRLDIGDADVTPVGGDDAVALEERREFAFHVGVVARVEEAFERIEADDGVDPDIGEGGRKGVGLVDDAGGIGGEDGKFGTFAVEFEQHGDPVMQAGAEDILGDVPCREHGRDVLDAIDFERGFEQVDVGERWGVVRGGKESKASLDWAAGIEPRDRGVRSGIKFREEVAEGRIGHGTMVARVRRRGARGRSSSRCGPCLRGRPTRA